MEERNSPVSGVQLESRGRNNTDRATGNEGRKREGGWKNSPPRFFSSCFKTAEQFL